APRVFSLATDRQRLLLAVQSHRPVTCGLADQRVVLQQAREQRLVLAWCRETLRIVERTAHQGGGSFHVAGEVLDLGKQVGPAAGTDLVPIGTCHLQPAAGMLASIIETPAIQLNLRQPEQESCAQRPGRLSQRSLGELVRMAAAAAATAQSP